MASKTIQAAGGIVVRKGARPLVAVVQRSKDDRWVLPRGKLKRDENPVTGAQREVIEETGHRVQVNEFLGAITYRAGGRPKVVQFWHMHAEEEATYELMTDIVAVEWLSLKAAVRRLSYPLEKLFLRNVGHRAVTRRKAGARRKSANTKATKSKAAKKTKKKSGKKTAKKPNMKSNKKPGKKAAKPAAKPHKPGKAKRHAPAAARAARSHRAQPKSQLEKSHAVRSHAANSPSLKIAAPERALPPVAIKPVSAKPITAAERKTILQRMLGRLAR